MMLNVCCSTFQWKLEQHVFFILSGNLVQLKDDACEGKTLTALPSASILHRLVSFVATKCETQ